ncbi:hypothetical protein AAG747_25045 [Rapidithrix thailandica]|uniref:Outer membrane protein beta-barrel domain-containing protein n=1 Tax=Rapidithrix thailandica TaxID=413964 RepID=A0AAW9SFW9_9BACT
MKPWIYHCLAMICCLVYCSSYAQVDESVDNTASYGLHTQGNWFVDFSTHLNFYRQKRENASETITDFRSFGFSPTANYFLIDNLAVGLEVSYFSSSSKTEGSDNRVTISDLTFAPQVRYYPFEEHGLFAFAEGGFGWEYIKTKSNGSSNRNTDNLSFLNFGVGFETEIADRVVGDIKFAYGFFNRKSGDTDFKDKQNGLMIDVGVNYFFSHERDVNTGRMCNYPDRFSAGTFITGTGIADFDLLNFDEEPDTNPNDENGTFFSFSPMVQYYFWDNIALGLDLDVGWDRYKSGDEKDTDTWFIAGPNARIHLPVKNYMPYAYGAVNFGTITFKEEDDGETDKQTNSIREIRLGLGYPLFVTDQLAFDAMLYYFNYWEKENDEDFKITENGVRLQVGVSYFFDF